jgi:hypothetical protein
MFDSFFDREYVRRDICVEDFRSFKKFAEFYPDSYFTLDTRDMASWINSRCGHADGRYLRWAMARNNTTKDQVMELQKEAWIEHHASFGEFFDTGSHRHFEFDIDRTPIDGLIALVRLDSQLDAEFWTQQCASSKPRQA